MGLNLNGGVYLGMQFSWMNELIYSGLITIVSLIEQNIVKILNIVLILYWLGKGLRALNTLSQAMGYPDEWMNEWKSLIS